jgi:DNA-directed RNA polymerase subunit RPC12/RpoP
MEWACEYCGDEGETREDVDRVQCPSCGEPVVPRV